MPAMGGLEATASIRHLEDHAQAQVPIIAMTALALQDDRRRCLAAGMDDYLAKPISARSLIACVEFYGTVRNVAAPSAALVRLGGDESLLHELIRLFLEDAPSLVEKIRAGLDGGDSEAVARAAHNLMGLAANFDAAPTVDAAKRIERLAGSDDGRALRPALADLEAELTLLQSALEVHQRRF
jgi:CheY-like chemotaxis protein